jgi:hypothetical protein
MTSRNKPCCCSTGGAAGPGLDATGLGADATGTAGKSAKRQIDLALNYSQGPLKVGIARVDVDMKAEAAVTTATVNSLVSEQFSLLGTDSNWTV